MTKEIERQVVYKRVKVLMLHCPVCKEQLFGNNSTALPYQCACGIWESDWMNPMNYQIKVKAL